MKDAPEVAREALRALRDLSPAMRCGIVVIAGAAGAAIAIALMELLAEGTAIPLLFVPFATSIVLIMGSPDIEPEHPKLGHLMVALATQGAEKLAQKRGAPR